MGQLQTIEPQLVELGYQILAISPDLPDKLVQTIEDRKLSYTLLSDNALAAARAFGIAFQPEGRQPLPVPSVFVLGTDGLIRFEYVNPEYQVRLDLEVLLAAAKAALRR